MQLVYNLSSYQILTMLLAPSLVIISPPTLTPPSLYGRRPISCRMISAVAKDGTSFVHLSRIAAHSYGHISIFSQSKFLDPPKVTMPSKLGIM